MYNDSAKIMILNTITSTHPGSGTELSYVDMPIQREGHTGYPKIEASTLKGCIRYEVSQRAEAEKAAKKENGDINIKEEMIDRIFGKPDNGDFASAVSMTDARILFFPVKSAKGVFGWVTCPLVLNRFFKDYGLAFGAPFSDVWNVPEEYVCSTDCQLSQKRKRGKKEEEIIMLEDYTYTVTSDEKFTQFLDKLLKYLPENSITKDLILNRAVVLSDDDFSSFVKYSTEVNTRIKIQTESGTAAGKALFTEEYLPPESILYSLIFFTDSHQSQGEHGAGSRLSQDQVKEEFMKLFPGGILQVGANSTLGKGLMQVSIEGVN